MPDSDHRPVIDVTPPSRSFTDTTATHPWVWTARKNLGGAGDLLGTLAVVRKLAEAWENGRTLLGGDPWLDERFADRFTTRVRWATGPVLAPGTLGLSDAETALLVTFPYLHQAFWAQRAVAVLQGADPAAAAFSSGGGLPDFAAFAADHGFLHRRGVRAFAAGEPAANSIAWWLFHRWLVRRPDCYGTSGITTLLPTGLPEPLNSVLSPARLTELMRVVQIDPAFLRRADRPTRLKPITRIAGGTEHEQPVREQLLGYVIALAHRMAIDPAVLPRDVVDHIGIDDGVTPDEVLTSIRAVEWGGTRTRALTTVCSHPATALALRHQAGAVDSVLAEIVGASDESDFLAPLKNLPVHASADGVSIEPGDNAARAPAAIGHRFRMADDQIQKLLMGEQLYGSPELAIRELYQNALDACRYREARTTYLTCKGRRLPRWRGQISFRQDVDEKGPFLECEDNGIGMGDRELIDVFARAGVTFHEMPEYLEEQADWAAEDIRIHPNSTFGIGVLSYFMLADEITVTTCRLDREGNPGRRLEVHIAGPRALFRVRDLGQGEDAGTTVRLRLRPTGGPAHCTDLLRRILWVSDYEVTSEDSTGRQTWEPGCLSRMAPIGAKDVLDPHARQIADRIVPAPGDAVWWCDTTGAVLSDGIWAGTTMFGVVVNLKGADRPRLTVDRRTIIDLDKDVVENLLRPAIPALLEASRSPLSHGWLSELVQHMPRLADTICERAIEVRYRPWQVGEVDLPIEMIGCFPLDRWGRSLGSSRATEEWSDRVSRWRLQAWLPSPEIADAVVPARPTDDVLLTEDFEPAVSGGWLPDDAPPVLGHVLTAALRTQQSPAEVARRLVVLGYPAPDPHLLPAEARTTDPLLLSSSRSSRPPWLSIDEPVPHDHVLQAAISAELTPHAVAQRLMELGYEVPTASRLPAVVHPVDKRLLQPGPQVAPPRLDATVSVAHLLIAAAQTGRTPGEAARRLAELGYPTPDPDTLPREHDSHDLMLFADASGALVQSPVPLWRITTAAITSGRSPAAVAARFAEAGFEVPPDDRVPGVLQPSDTALTHSYYLDGDAGSRPVRDPVITIGHVLCAAVRTGQSPVQVAHRLAELGFTTPPRDLLTEEADRDDILAVSSTIGDYFEPYDGRKVSYWLSTGEHVPLEHVMIAAAKTHRAPLAVERRLRELGFGTPPGDLLDLDVDDVVLLSVGLDGNAPWLHTSPALARSGRVLPLGHVLVAAARLGRAPAEVAGRLAAFGLSTEAADLPAKVEPFDARLLCRTVDLESWLPAHPDEFPWLGTAETAGRTHLLIVAGKTGLATDAVAHRLAALGIPVEDPHGLPKHVDEKDLRLLSEHFSDPAEVFPPSRVMIASAAMGIQPGEVIARLERLGFTIGD